MQPIERADVLFSFSNVIPDSRASGRPWTNISSDEATAECNELDSVYFGTSIANSGFELISNTQWMVIARTLEATSSNWSTGTQGSGSLFKGNSFNGSDAEAERIGALLSGTTGFALASSQSDAKPYFGTGQSSGSTKRIFHLPNDQNIWDFSGNVWQWVKDSRTDLGIASSDESILSTAAVLSFQTSNTNTFSSQTNKIFGSFGTSGVQLPQTSSPGQILPGNGGAVARGGGYASGSETGLFATTLGWSPATRNSFAGFRCVYMPPPAPP